MSDAPPPAKSPEAEQSQLAGQVAPVATPSGQQQVPPSPVNRGLAAALKAFWTSFPGILTAIGGLIAAAATLITALDKAVWLRPTSTRVTLTAIIVPASSPMPTLVATSGNGAMPTAAPPMAAPSATPTTGTILPEGGLLADDFSDPKSGWQTETAKEYKLAYADGAYSIMVRVPDLAVWGAPIRPYEFSDLLIKVDAWQVSGPTDVDYGLVVRSHGENALYFFAVSSDGNYSVHLLQDDSWQQLVEWTMSKAVKPQGQVNHLQVECVGMTMTFWVNGEKLVQLADGALRSGNIGLLVSTFDHGEAEARFDNVRVQVLKRF